MRRAVRGLHRDLGAREEDCRWDCLATAALLEGDLFQRAQRGARILILFLARHDDQIALAHCEGSHARRGALEVCDDELRAPSRGIDLILDVPLAC